MFRLLNAASILTDKTLRFDGHQGLAKGILVRYTGTAQTAQTAAASHLGTVDGTIGADSRIHANLAQMLIVNRIDLGQIRQISAQAGAFDLCFYLPFEGRPDGRPDGNRIPLTAGDYLEIPAVSSVVAASATVSLYGDFEDGPHIYWPRLWTRSATLSSESPIPLPVRNLYSIAYAEPSTGATKVLLDRNARRVMDCPHEVAEIAAEMFGRNEASGAADTDAVQLWLGQLPTIRGASYSLQMVGGAGELVYTTLSCDFVSSINGNVVDIGSGAIEIGGNKFSAGAVKAGPGVQIVNIPTD